MSNKKEYYEYLRNVIGLENCIYNNTDKTLPFGYLPPDYKIRVPCGKCVECFKTKRLSWSFRLANEVQQHKECTFLTLTLDDKNLARFRDNPKKPLLLFIDRLRKELGFRPKYFFVSELGSTTKRLHYHGIFFGTSKNKFPYDVQRKKWQYGHVWLAPFCDVRTANYITKYMLKFEDNYKPVLLCSNGIGINYVTPQSKKQFINNFEFKKYVKVGSSYYPISRYYQDKFLDDELKVIKMLNNVYDARKRSYIFRKQEYSCERDYQLARFKFYEWTLKTNIYGSIHNSQTRVGGCSLIESSFKHSENNEFQSWYTRSDSLQRYSPWRQCSSESRLFD